MTTVNLIARDNDAGLSVDLQIVADVLRAAGFDVTITALGHRSRLVGHLVYGWSLVRRLGQRLLSPGPRYRQDINVMLERVQPELLADARYNVLVPNPEWFRDDWRRWLPQFDRVLAKTRYAESIFNGLGCTTRLVGFSSRDHWLPQITRRPHFLHLPGRSNNKGTRALLQLWREHPQWPCLTVLWRSREAQVAPLPGNVRWLRERLDDTALAELQNAHAFHLCPSETEGYGHYLAEALGVGAVTVTLDAPPMNELVTTERGVLCPAQSAGTQALATLYRFDAEAMRVAIERCITMDEQERTAIGARARTWFVENTHAFPARLRDALRELVGSDGITPDGAEGSAALETPDPMPRTRVG